MQFFISPYFYRKICCFELNNPRPRRRRPAVRMDFFYGERVAVVGAFPRIVGSIAFAIARRAVARDPTAHVLLISRRREAPPLPVLEARAAVPAALGGHGDGADLERIALKYAETCADVAWLLNNLHNADPSFTLLVIDDVAEFVATGAPSLDADAPLARLCVLAKLAANAADWLGGSCVLASADGSPRVRTAIRRYFPRIRVVENAADADEWTHTVRDHGETAPGALLRDCGTLFRIRPS